MSTKYLRRFFNPRSIAVFGASERANSMGGIVLRNLLDSGFEGPLMAVNSRGYEQVNGVPCYPDVASLPEMPELAIICTPAETVAEIVRKLGVHRVRAVMLLTGGLSLHQSERSKTLREQVLEAARPYGVRVLGPDCMGMLVPGSRMNASYSHINIRRGRVGYVGQSGLLGTAMIDWARGREIGFSHFLTLGDGVDVGLSSIIDYLARDPYTHALLLQMDRVLGSARNFISALRAASRTKLVLVLKSNIVSQQWQAHNRTPGLLSQDQVYDAALRRAGVVRVEAADELFNALETLTRMKPMRGERLAIICNGMGPNALAMDRLRRKGGTPAQLSENTLTALRELIPPEARHENPVDLNADADPERFAAALQLLVKDPNVDAVLVIHAPTRLAPSVETAEAVAAVAEKCHRNVLTCWMGRYSAIAARNTCNVSGIVSFMTPEEAVDAFMHMVDYHRNQRAMRQTPAPYHSGSRPNRSRAERIIAFAHNQDRRYLLHDEVSEILNLYEIDTANTLYATDVDGAVTAAQKFDGTVAVKALHTRNMYPFCYDQSARLRWHDLATDLYSLTDVRKAAVRLQQEIVDDAEDDALLGFAIQPMKRGFQSLQINVGVTRDRVFGPLIVFGVGGYTVDVLADRQVMLPPLNQALAQEMIRRSRISHIIEENSYQVERDIDMLCTLLMRLSDLIVELPEIETLEINPLLLNKKGLMAIDFTMSIGTPMQTAIHPYPEDLTEKIVLKKSGRPAILRAVRGEDEPTHLEFYNSLSPDTVRLRYFNSRGVPSHDELANWTQIDYDREMAFIISAARQDGDGYETLGVARAVTDADNVNAEFSVVIRDNLQGEGLGTLLMQKVVDYCRDRGTLQLSGTTLRENKGMQTLARNLGFAISYNAEEEVVEMKMLLNEPGEDWQRSRLEQ